MTLIPYERKRLLVLAKTYPAISAKYAETCCVAAADEDGKVYRLYPIPFRGMAAENKFKKWEWIDCEIAVPNDDHRPESRRVAYDTIQRTDHVLTIKDHLDERRRELDKIPVFESLQALREAAQDGKCSLGLIKPLRVVRAELTKDSANWSAKQQRNMTKAYRQGRLEFNDEDSPEETLDDDMLMELDEDTRAAFGKINPLEKLPLKVHLVFECMHNGQIMEERIIVHDWEMAMLCRNVLARDSDRDVQRQKILDQINKVTNPETQEVMLLMGNMHRLPENWMIGSVIYLPKRKQQELL